MLVFPDTDPRLKTHALIIMKSCCYFKKATRFWFIAEKYLDLHKLDILPVGDSYFNNLVLLQFV